MGNQSNCCQRCEDVKHENNKTVTLKEPAVKQTKPMPHTHKIPLAWDYEKDCPLEIKLQNDKREDDKNGKVSQNPANEGSAKNGINTNKTNTTNNSISRINQIIPVGQNIREAIFNPSPTSIDNGGINLLPYSCMGLLYIHFPEDNQLYMGTAFQIGSKEAVTCAHHCFHRSQMKEASRILYFPCVMGRLDISSGIEVSKFKYPDKYREEEYWERGTHQYAHLTLSMPNICSEGYFKVGFDGAEVLKQLSESRMTENQGKNNVLKQIRILGYPASHIQCHQKVNGKLPQLYSQAQSSNKPIAGTHKKQQDLQISYMLCQSSGKAQIYSQIMVRPQTQSKNKNSQQPNTTTIKDKQSIIERLVYNISPELGMQGSPIFYESKGSFIVLGIHHGKAFNKYPAHGSSCLLTTQVKNKVLEWKGQMKDDEENKTLLNKINQNGKVLVIKQKQLSDTRNSIIEIKLRKQSEDGKSVGLGTIGKDIEVYRRAVEIFQKILGKNNYEYANACLGLGSLLLEQKTNQEAARYFEEAERVLQVTIGKKTEEYGACLNNLGTTLYKIGRREEGLQRCQRSLVIRQEILGKDHPDYASTLFNIGLVMEGLGRIEQSLKYHLEALEKKRERFGRKSLQAAGSLSCVAGLYKKLGRDEECLEAYRDSLQIRQEVSEKQDNLQVAKILFTIAPILYETARYDECLQAISRSLEIKKKLLGEMNQDYQNTLKVKGKLEEKIKKKKEKEEKRDRSSRKSGRSRSSISKKKHRSKDPMEADYNE